MLTDHWTPMRRTTRRLGICDVLFTCIDGPASGQLRQSCTAT